MKISASLYSNKARSIKDLITELDRCYIDYFHIDCNDDLNVFDDIRYIKTISSTSIDLHIITSTPEKYFDAIADTLPQWVTFQYENLPPHTVFPNIKGVKYGLAITSDTPIHVFEEYQSQCEFVLIMTTTPGQSGGIFRKDNFKRIRKFRNQFPGVAIHVDGGVNSEIGFVLRLLGVNSVVSGNFLVNHPSLGEALLHLRSSVIYSNFLVKDFMIEEIDAPVLVMGAFDVKDVIKKIEEGNLGYALIKDKKGKLVGMSSNADVRKGLVKNLDNLNAIDLADIINTCPVVVNENASISEVLDLIHSKTFLISYLPVVDDHQLLKGTITFNQLIRSES